MLAAGKPLSRRPATGVRTPKQRAGNAAEDAAARRQVAHGCMQISRIARYPEGEVDLIAREREQIVFVEVRMRCGSAFGGAAASVDRYKQKRLMRAAQHWMLERSGDRCPERRFDVVSVAGDGTIEWIRDAFAA
jgi:putative endonuclease